MLFGPRPFPLCLLVQQDKASLQTRAAKAQGSLYTLVPIPGLSYWEGQDFGVSRHTPSYLLLRPSSGRVYPRGRGGGPSSARPHWWEEGWGLYLGTAPLRMLGPPALACRAMVLCQERQAEMAWDIGLFFQPPVQFLKQRHSCSQPPAPESWVLPGGQALKQISPNLFTKEWTSFAVGCWDNANLRVPSKTVGACAER